MKRNIVLLIIVFALVSGSVFAQSSKPDLVIDKGNQDTIFAGDFSPDGKVWATGGLNAEIKIWGFGYGYELAMLKGHSDSITAIKFSPNGQVLASASKDGTIKLWDVTTGKELKSLAGHKEAVRSIAFDSTGRILASGSDDKILKLWDAATGQELRSLSGHSDAVSCVSFSPNGKILASGSADKSIKLWDVSSGQILKSLSGNPSGIISLAFDIDGQSLITVNEVGDINFYNSTTGEKTKAHKGGSTKIDSAEFSKNRKYLATIDQFDADVEESGKEIKIRDVSTGQEIKMLRGSSDLLTSLSFFPEGTGLASTNFDQSITFWNFITGQKVELPKVSDFIQSFNFGPTGEALVSLSFDKKIRLWRFTTNKEPRAFQIHSETPVEDPIFSPDGKTLAFIDGNGLAIGLVDVSTGKLSSQILTHSDLIKTIAFSPDGKTFATGSWDATIKLWDTATIRELKTLCCVAQVKSLVFSPDGKTLASGSSDKPGADTRYSVAKLWDLEKGTEIKELKGNSFSDKWIPSQTVTYNSDSALLALGGCAKKDMYSSCSEAQISIWDVKIGQEMNTLKIPTEESVSTPIKLLAFAPDGKTIASGASFEALKIWNVATGQNVKFDKLPEWAGKAFGRVINTPNDKTFRADNEGDQIVWRDDETGSELVSLIGADKDNWIVTTPDGRFDTNKSLDRISGLHWVVNDEILKPLSLGIFMRQYFEPGLLQRALNGEQFKKLPSIADINRVQPKVVVKEIKPVANSTDSVDLTIELENVTEDVSLSATDRTKKKQLSSGAFDLRLFRDGQLVGVSAPKKDLEEYIRQAPALIEKDKLAKTLINTEENKAWRAANDIFKLKTDDVKFISPTKAEYTFRNVKLPKDGRKKVEFTVYAFNSDRVKSNNVSKTYQLPETTESNPAKKGRAVVVSIGVNASENPAYDLYYAANDAREMQKIVGERLKTDGKQYSEIIQISLISDYGEDKKLLQQTAQKEIIKSVFSLMSGKDLKDVLADAAKVNPKFADILKSVPNVEKLKAIEPEDTLIITYSGHGYADQSGIFYLLPYDIGKETLKLTPEALQKTISSDELSLWMQDITAAEMIMIIDACHSSAAVQGDGFKPGPMGSRGLGQLAYDKDMKILSATQANNVALELGSLQQGLLSYALLQDGIVSSLADADKNKQLFSNEWLTYAEKRVPELYTEVKEGKREIVINGKNITIGAKDVETINLDGAQKSSLNLQQPSLFDFKRRQTKNSLFKLP